ncbi:TonB-dependent receptor [Chitinophaga lutea]
MRHRLFFFAICILTGPAVFAQQTVVKGVVRQENGQPAPFVNIAVPALKKGAIAAANGTYVLTVPAGTHSFRFSGVGLKPAEQIVAASGDTTIADMVLASSGDLQEVIVSASRKQETLDEVPSSVTIVGPRELAVQKGISNNVADILANTVPGLGFSSNQTGNTGQTLRGRNLLVMIDGIPQSTPLRNGGRDLRTIDPSAIERVEVIKGATAIYGNGADGGLINYITKKGDHSKPLSGQTTVGANTQLKSAQHTGGFAVGQLLSGAWKKWDFVASGQYEQTGVYKDARGGIITPDYGLGETQLWNGFAKIGHQFDERNRLELMYNFFGSQQRSDYVQKIGRYGFADSATIGVLGKRPGAPEGTPYNHNASLHYSSKGIIGGTDLDVNLYMQRFNTVYSWVTSFENGGQSQITSKKQGLRINFSSPLRLGAQYDADLVYGLDFMNDVTSQSLTDGRGWVPEMDMKNYAPYAQIKTTFFKHLVLKAGARFENINIGVPDYVTIKSQNRVTGQFTEGGVAVKGGTLRYNALVYNAGLRYNQWRFFKPFVSYSQSFSILELGRQLRTAKENTLGLLQTKAIIAHNYEAGFNSTLGPVDIEASYYISTSALGSTFQEVNGRFEVARSPEKVYGFEIVADARLLHNLSAGASYSYVEGKRDVNDNGKYGDADDAWMGGDRISAPKATAYVRYAPVSNWSLRLQMLYAGDRHRFEPKNGIYAYGTGPINAFATFSLFSNLDLDAHSSISVGVDNLFNKDYFTVLSQMDGRNENWIKGTGARLRMQYTYKF